MYTIYPDHIYRIADKAHIPLDPENTDFQAFQDWRANGGEPVPPPVPPFKDRQAALLVSVDKHLNKAARAIGYDDIRTAVSYADEPAVAKFQAEGQALRAWRSLVYQKCYQVLAQVVAGELAEPTADELLGMLPELQLPQ